MIVKKKHKATNTNININIKQNDTRNIHLNIGITISDKGYGAISTIGKMQKLDMILLNRQVIVIL